MFRGNAFDFNTLRNLHLQYIAMALADERLKPR